MKILHVLISAVLAAALLTQPVQAAEAPSTSAAAYVLMEADTGRVLAGDHEDEPRLIASTTKIMTALLALEALDTEAEVEIEPAWAGIEGSTMYLAPGQRLTVRDLLYGLMLASGNDAAVALACLAAGSVPDFADRMNRRAAALGCEHTHFENPNGLDGEEHYASARDLALITREALKNDEFVRIASTVSARVGEYTFTNHNRLLRECEGVFGVKTGYTEAAGRTLVTCCEREGMTLICVTLNDPDDWADHAALYDWGYETFSLDTAADRQSFWPVPVVGGETDAVTAIPAEPLRFPRREGDSVALRVELPAFVHAPVELGAAAGRITLLLDGAPLCAAELRYGGDAAKTESIAPGWRDRLALILRLAERKVYALV